MADIPTGTVTFLFTDIEGSTRLLNDLGARYADVVDAQQRIVRDACGEHGGTEIDTQGDSFFFAFGRALEAVTAAAKIQRRLVAHDWSEGRNVRLRMGIHTGEPLATGERYVGMGVNRAARVSALGHGGQVLVSNTTRELVEDELPHGLGLRDLGQVRLRDIARPERVFQLEIAGLQNEFPPLAGSGTRVRTRRRTLVGAVLGSVALVAVVGVSLYLGTRSSEPGARGFVGSWIGVDRDGSRPESDIRPVAGQSTYELTLRDADAEEACGGGAVRGKGVGALEGNDLVFESLRLTCSHGAIREFGFVLTYRESEDTIIDPDGTIWSRAPSAGDG